MKGNLDIFLFPQIPVSIPYRFNERLGCDWIQCHPALFQFLIGSMKGVAVQIHPRATGVSIPYRFNERLYGTEAEFRESRFNSL